MLGSTNVEAYKEMYALVGQYLHLWSFMESRMNRAVEKALDMQGLQAIIVCCNVNFYSKCHILKTALQLQTLGYKTKEEHTEVIRRLSDLQNLAHERNMVAHDSFFPDENLESVKFYVFKAKGNFTMPNAFWKPEDFQAKFAKIIEFTNLLDDISSRIVQGKIAKALTDSATKKERNALADLLRHGHLLQADRTSGTLAATGQIDEQTPPSSEEKSQ